MSQTRPFHLVLLAMALLVASTCSAASIKEPLPEARRLLKLVEMVNNGDRPTLDDVVEGYKEYVRLYEIQTDLAAKFDGGKGGKLGFEDKYQRISQVLSQSGLETITTNLFAAFDSVEPEQRLVVTKRLRKDIENAIKDLSGH